jgi:hypothetical protein
MSKPLVLPRPLAWPSTSTRSPSSSRYSSASTRHSSQALSQLRQPSSRPARPGPTTGGGPVCDHVLDFGVRPLDRAEVAALPASVYRADHLHVLARHRPRSIAARGGRRTSRTHSLSVTPRYLSVKKTAGC